MPFVAHEDILVKHLQVCHCVKIILVVSLVFFKKVVIEEYCVINKINSKDYNGGTILLLTTF